MNLVCKYCRKILDQGYVTESAIACSECLKHPKLLDEIDKLRSDLEHYKQDVTTPERKTVSMEEMVGILNRELIAIKKDLSQRETRVPCDQKCRLAMAQEREAMSKRHHDLDSRVEKLEKTIENGVITLNAVRSVALETVKRCLQKMVADLEKIPV